MKLNESLGYLLNLTARNLKRELDENIRKYNLTSSQWALVKLLLEKGELSQVEIAENMQSDKATVGAIVDKLVNKGLVIRGKNDTDKRSYKIKILKDGRDLATKLTKDAINTNNKALQGFKDEDIRKLLDYLEIINSNLRGE
ncbi:MarR family winged helix-turn-helix transcriptional regulator [Clostridium paraputrificum]|uniref:MarR family winged helix-turn-helix transcriptional regulator n=1 Tax=Clostridium paraputrificum TaxID=29363 RepID=UPI003D34AA9B